MSQKSLSADLNRRKKPPLSASTLVNVPVSVPSDSVDVPVLPTPVSIQSVDVPILSTSVPVPSVDVPILSTSVQSHFMKFMNEGNGRRLSSFSQMPLLVAS